MPEPNITQVLRSSDALMLAASFQVAQREAVYWTERRGVSWGWGQERESVREERWDKEWKMNESWWHPMRHWVSWLTHFSAANKQKLSLDFLPLQWEWGVEDLGLHLCPTIIMSSLCNQECVYKAQFLLPSNGKISIWGWDAIMLTKSSARTL